MGLPQPGDFTIWLASVGVMSLIIALMLACAAFDTHLTKREFERKLQEHREYLANAEMRNPHRASILRLL